MVLACAALPAAAAGHAYPERPVRVFVGLAPGGGTDSVARVMTQKLSDVSGWYGFAAPAGTPKAVIEPLNTAMNRALPELRERYANLGMDIGGGTAAEFGAHLKSERDKWARVVKISGAKVD